MLELTNGKPAFTSGTLQVNRPRAKGGGLHCAREDYGWESCRYETRNGHIYCDYFVVFPYFDDVFPGDGGLLVVPGSHKAAFDRPRSLFNGGQITDVTNLPDGVINLTPRAGDILIISELLTHGILPWTPRDRIRRILVLRYKPQHVGRPSSFPEPIASQLSPETHELIAHAHHTHTKEISKREIVSLSPMSGQ